MSSAVKRTIAVYQQDSAIRELAAKITSCNLVSSLSESERSLFKTADDNDYVLATDRTIFHAQGGGQPSDTGTISSPSSTKSTKESPNNEASVPNSNSNSKPATSPPIFNVKLVRKLPDDRILHHGIFAPSPNSNSSSNPTPSSNLENYKPGASILQKIDSAKRDYHSRLHTAGHLLGLAVRQLSASAAKTGTPAPLPPNFREGKANHAPGAAFVEFHGLISGEHKEAIQKQTNELVKQDLEVRVSWLSEEQARAVCTDVPDVVTTGQDAEGNDADVVRVVEVVGVGAYPCGGTHLGTTGLVGEVVVRGIKRQKGVTKISYGLVDEML